MYLYRYAVFMILVVVCFALSSNNMCIVRNIMKESVGRVSKERSIVVREKNVKLVLGCMRRMLGVRTKRTFFDFWYIYLTYC